MQALTPDSPHTPPLSPLGFLRRTPALLRPYTGRGVGVLLGLVVNACYQMMLPLSFKFLIDQAIVPHDGVILAAVLLGMALAFVVATAADLGRDYLTTSIGVAIGNDLRRQLFRYLHGVSFDVFAMLPAGELLARFTTDLSAVEQALTRALPKIISCTIQVVVSAVLLLVIDWRLALAAVIAFPIALLGPRLFAARASQAGIVRKNAEAQTLAIIQESLLLQPVIRAGSLERWVAARLDARLTPQAQHTARAAFLSRLVARTTDAGQICVQLFVIGTGAWLALRGELSIGSLIAFLGLLITMGYAFFQISDMVPELYQGAAGLTRIDALLALPLAPADAPGAYPLGRLAEGIRLEGVTFQYPGRPPALEDVTLTLPAGGYIAIVGHSGAGKSTLLQLLLRFVAPTHGSIFFDGHALSEVTGASLHQQIGVVFQEVVLFQGTIADNIRLDRDDTPDSALIAAAQAAGIHDVIVALPQGYATAVGERGVQFSVGQRQRIALARALLGDPALLLLDEATAALDPETANAIERTLLRIAAGRTVISVTHRQAVAAAADLVVVFAGGRVVGTGTHAELLAANESYGRLWQAYPDPVDPALPQAVA